MSLLNCKRYQTLTRCLKTSVRLVFIQTRAKCWTSVTFYSKTLPTVREPARHPRGCLSADKTITGNLDKITLHASFDGTDSTLSERELHDTSTEPGLITSTMFNHMQPFAKCTPITLKEITLQKIRLRYAADTYCKLIDFRSVKSIRIFGCPGADALFAELSKSTRLPDRLETLEFKHEDNSENDGLAAIDGFLCLVSGIQTLTLDLAYVKTLPASAGIVRHGKTLKTLNVHANTTSDMCEDELVYDYSSFSQICKECPSLEQVSFAFPHVSVMRNKNDSFINFEVSRFIPDFLRINSVCGPLGVAL